MMAPNQTRETLSLYLPQPSSPPPEAVNVHLRRRHLLSTTAFTISFNFNLSFTTSLSVTEPVAGASGLFQMPPPRLTNR